MAKVQTPYIEIKEIKEKIEKYSKTVTNSGVVFERTLKDMGSRAPGKVADAVRSVYNIKKTEITCKKGFSKTAAGTIGVRGQEIANFELVYEGRVLTPLHFSMTPKTRPENKKKYKVKAKIKGEKKKTFTAPTDGGVFLAPASKSSTVIPWLRHSVDKHDITPIKTVSLPQMVANEEVSEVIHKEIGELFQKRLDHHLNRHLNKNLD